MPDTAIENDYRPMPDMAPRFRPLDPPLPPEMEWLAMNLLVLKPSAFRNALFAITDSVTATEISEKGELYDYLKKTLMETVILDSSYADRILSDVHYQRLFEATHANAGLLSQVREKVLNATGAYDPGSSSHPGINVSHDLFERMVAKSVKQPLGPEIALI